jgi:hypothetical protein
MALRSLGATLLAKAGTGSALRNLDEKASQGAVPSGNTSAQPTSTSRSNVNQPIEIAVPGGTQKQVAVKPQIQPNMSSSPNSVPLSQGAGLVPQMGGGAAAAAANQNINAPSVSSPISAPFSMRATSSKSSGAGTARAAAGVQPMLDMISPSGVGSKNAPSQTNSYNPVSVPFTLGNRASAAEGGNNEVGRSAIQGAAATIANAIQGGGVDQKATNPVSQALINFANTPSKAKSTGIMSNINKAANTVQKTVQSAPSTLRSVASQASNTAQNVVKQVTNVLRSLFRW